ncbi:NAD(P)/FAD-dependent oxidoreductase [soil metagenome]
MVVLYSNIFLIDTKRYICPVVMEKQKIAIIGAGPAGLTAAYQLAKAGQEVTVFESDPQYVGGISRTENYKGYLFDIGGHRFFSKNKEVEDLWTEILPNDMLERPRSSSIFYKRRFFSYPLNATEALRKLGLTESVHCVLSYIKAKLFPVKNPLNFEDWVSNHFGRRLYIIFFKTYTEKVWGIPCKEISADWAVQRIKGLSLSSAIKNAIIKSPTGSKGPIIKTLIDTFRYPRLGPGMMWNACAEKSKAMGASILMNATVNTISLQQNKWQITTASHNTFGGFDYVLSSAPIAQLLPAVEPALPGVALHAAKQLKYRDFITVILILKDEHTFNENWIYVHDPAVKAGRVQNFKSWSPDMVPDETMACYGLEYFCFEGDGMWQSSDTELITLGKHEIEKIGLATASAVTDGYVVRQKRAYPVYDHDYKENIMLVKEALRQYPGLYLMGRNGMHKYNNQDHSMMTAMLAVKNILAGEELYDLWKVNQDAEYHEEGESAANKGGRMIPEKI